ncbi:MAG: hypothetical protein GY822_11905, partial [Deltaproteobacteria bacterium]|nr:hypothetical protein [Deltaproteobacteria bacterium]
WQATIALIFAKLYREIVKYTGIVGAIGLGLVGVGMIAPTLLAGFAPGVVPAIPAYYLPVALAGLVTFGGASFIVWKKIRNVGTDWTFSGTYWLLSGQIRTQEERDEAMKNALVKWPPEGTNRAWALMATSAGTEPERKWHFYIPVVGAWNKAMARGKAVKASMRRVSQDVLDEEKKIRPTAYEEMDGMITTLAVVEGGLAAGAQAALLTGGALFVGGTLAAAVQYQSTEDFGNYAILAGVTGTVGVVVASTGVAMLLVREVPKALRPFAAPLVYGLGAPGEE